MEKIELLRSLIMELHKHEGDPEVFQRVKAKFQKDFGTVSSMQIAQMEQSLLLDGMSAEKIRRLCNVHAEVFQGAIEDLHSLDTIDQEEGHPLFVFRKENEGLISLLDKKAEPMLREYDKNTTEEIRQDLLAITKELSKVSRHYDRKENLFFPYLEQNGITGPSKVMWAKDDEIRDIFKAVLRADDLKGEALSEKLTQLFNELRSMVTKENDFLSPMLVKNIPSEAWLQIAEDAPTLGYAFNGGIEGASPSDAAFWLDEKRKNMENTSSDKDSSWADSSSYVADSKDALICFPSANIRLEDLCLLLNTSPVDFTYIDKEDKVAFFTEGKDPVFPRTRTIIGRDVRNCHPPRAQAVLNQLLADFKAGIKDEEIRTVNIGTKVLLIRYYAVRDEERNYIGTLEVTEEISKYRAYLDGENL